MNTEFLLKNKPISEKILEAVSQFEDPRDEFLFAIQCDLLLDGSYGESAIFLTSHRLCAVDIGDTPRIVALDFSEIESVSVKRLYGNAIMTATLRDGEKKDLARFTFSVAELCEAAADFVKKVGVGESVEPCLEAVRSTFRNQTSNCPKCGKRLPSPDSVCIGCAGKKKLGASLYRFIKPHMGMLVLSLFLSALSTVASLIPPVITQTLVDDVIPSKSMRGLIYIIIFYVALHFTNSGIGVVKTYLLRITGNSIIGDLKKEIYAKAQYLPMKFYDKTSTGSVVNRINADTVTLQSFMMTMTQTAIVNVFTVIGIVVMMLVMNWKLTLMALIPVPLIVWISKLIYTRINPFYRRLWRRNASISGLLTDTIPAIRVVKSFSKEQTAVKKFSGNVDRWLDEDRRLGKIASLHPGFIGFLVMVGMAIIWFFGGKMVIEDPEQLSLGTLVSFISYTGMFYTPVNFFAVLGDTYQNAMTSAERIFDIINAEPEHDFGKGYHPDVIHGKIEFRNVNFSFDRSKKVLSDINFVIEPGDVVGIVGTTGSGKSTLINLLLRFYDDYDGEILVDDINIKDIDMTFFRNQVGYVQQEPVMFRDTIFNNIAYSKPDATPEEVINVADIANAHGFISRLPDSYDTLLGERGVGLSGGEKQRLSIARAVLKNPSILIFDEATSAVDSETEKLIQDAIDNIVYGRTTLMIAHRLSTLRKANKIIVVDNGRILEFGSPDELMAKKGKFYKLINIQSMSEKAESEKRAENFE